MHAITQSTPEKIKGHESLSEVISPVKVAAVKAVDKNFGSSDVCGNGDVVHIVKTQKVHIVCLRGLLVEGISEEKQHIDFVAGNTSGNLLSAALSTTKESFDLETCCIRNQLTCSTCSAEIVSGQNTAVASVTILPVVPVAIREWRLRMPQ